jgi:hypothetical protein
MRRRELTNPGSRIADSRGTVGESSNRLTGHMDRGASADSATFDCTGLSTARKCQCRAAPTLLQHLAPFPGCECQASSSPAFFRHSRKMKERRPLV